MHAENSSPMEPDWPERYRIRRPRNEPGAAEYARQVVRAAPVQAAISGFHLFALDDAGLKGPPANFASSAYPRSA